MHHVTALIATAVVVSADGDVTRRRVVEAMDAVRVAGISRMAIAVQPMEKR